MPLNFDLLKPGGMLKNTICNTHPVGPIVLGLLIAWPVCMLRNSLQERPLNLVGILAGAFLWLYLGGS